MNLQRKPQNGWYSKDTCAIMELDFGRRYYHQIVIDDIKSMDVRKYFTASLSFKSKDYDELVAMLKTAENKRIKLIVKTKNGIVKNFKIDFKYLSELMNDSRFEKVSIAVWRISDEKKS